MGWIKRRADAVKPLHNCPTPWRALRPPASMSGQTRVVQDREYQKAKATRTGAGVPVGDPGDIWACDDCGQVWVFIEPIRPRGGGYEVGGGRKWVRAGWWLQRKYGPRKSKGHVQ